MECSAVISTLISHNRAHAHRWTEYEAKYDRERLLEKVHNQPDIQRRRDEIHHAEEGIDQATMDFAADRIDDQLGRFKGRIRRDDWVEQAKLLSGGDTAAYEARFGKL